MTDLIIVNRALVRIGAAKASSMSDTALRAAKAIEAYPFARDEILRMFDWPSVTKRAYLFNTVDLVCQWMALHVYHLGDRVTNDTGKVYVCITAGTSAASGGPTGTTVDITDGTVHWDYVTTDDLTTNWAWTASTTWVAADVRANDDGKVYVCITAGTGAASAGPTGTNADITDGSAHWKYYATIADNLTVFGYCYLYPPDCLKVRRITDACTPDDKGPGYQYRREGRFIYTDADDAVVKYTPTQTGSSDPDSWDSLLQTAVGLRLAATICYDVTAKSDLASTVMSEWTATNEKARGVATAEGAEAPAEPESWA